MALAGVFEGVSGNSNHGSLAPASGATGQLIGASGESGSGEPTVAERNGLLVQIDPATAVTTPVLYLLLASTGTPSASNFDVAVTPTLPWDGMVGINVYRGAVQYKWVGSAAAQITVTEV